MTQSQKQNTGHTKIVPDPATVYERAKPEAEAGMGKLQLPPPPKHKHDPQPRDAAVDHAQDTQRQVNSDDEAGPKP